MRETRPPQIDELARRLQVLRIPEHSRDAIQSAIERRLDRRSRTRSWALAAAVVLFTPAAIIAAVRWWSAVPAAPPTQTRLQERSTQPTRPIVPSTPPRSEPRPAAQISPDRGGTRVSAPTRPRRRRPVSVAAQPARQESPSIPSDLALQVAAFRQALDLLGKNDRAALSRWRAMVERWPEGALRPEADLRIVEVLVRLGRKIEAHREAAAFLRRHPRSPAARQICELLRPGPSEICDK